MDILNLIKDSGNSVAFTDDFMKVIEDHLPWLKKHKDNYVITATPMQCYKYTGDFYSLLNELLVDTKLQYAVLRINGLINPTDFDGDSNNKTGAGMMITIPKQDVFNQLIIKYNSQNKMRK